MKSEKNNETEATYLLKIPTALHTALKIYSVKNKKTIRDCIIEAIKNYLKD